MKINNVCPMCGEYHSLRLPKDLEGNYKKYLQGAFIQEALPTLNPMEREFIKTGYCPECQELLFGSEFESDLIK